MQEQDLLHESIFQNVPHHVQFRFAVLLTHIYTVRTNTYLNAALQVLHRKCLLVYYPYIDSLARYFLPIPNIHRTRVSSLRLHKYRARPYSFCLKATQHLSSMCLVGESSTAFHMSGFYIGNIRFLFPRLYIEKPT